MGDAIAGLPGYRHLSLGAVGSTNDEATGRAAEGDPGGLWITAERQTRGRGRRRAPWTSGPGNLFASLLLRPGAESASDAQTPLLAALALHDAITNTVGPTLGERLAIKWPNDLLLDARKVSGILAEAGTAGGSRFVVIGFGVNCAHFPADTRQPATSLAAAGLPVAPGELFGALARTFAGRHAEWNGGTGFEATRQAWLARAAGLNRPISVRLPDVTLHGTFDGLDATGRLLLGTDRGERRISAGEVFFGQPAAMRSVPA